MLKKIKVSAVFLICLLAINSFGLQKINGRNVPGQIDFQDLGAARFMFQESLNVELVNILPTARNTATWQGLSVSTLASDTLSGTPIFTGAPVFNSGVTAFQTDTLKHANNVRSRPTYGILRTSKITIGHPGETTTDIAFASAANTAEQSLGADTIPAYARIVDVTIITTEAVAGITTSFTIDVGDGAGTDEFATATDIKAANALIGGDASEAILLQSITAATVVFVNATPAAENWSAMTGGEFTLLTTYYDYGSIK